MKGALGNLSDAELVKEFATRVKQYGSAVLDCDSRRANQVAEHLRAVEEAWYARGRQSRLQLQELLNDNDRVLRYYAAKHLLAIVPDRARKVIEENAKFWFDSLAADARMVLDLVDTGEYQPE